MTDHADVKSKTIASDRDMKIAFSTDLRSTDWTTETVSWSEFAEELQEFEETVAKTAATAFLPGALSGAQRTGSAITSLDLMVYDLDKGEALENVSHRVQQTGKTAVIYSTWSHLNNVTTVDLDKYSQFAGATSVSEAAMRRYLVEAKGIRPEFVSAIQISDRVDVGGRAQVRVTHAPIPKWRVVFPLMTAVQVDEPAWRVWKEKYSAFGNSLGLEWDAACARPSQAFYMPSCKPGAERYAAYFEGDFLAFEDIATPTSVIEARDVQPRPAFNLKRWIGAYGKSFALETAVRRRAPEHIRGHRSGQPGVHIECPFEDTHSTPGGNGTFVVNASDNGDRGFGLHCCHEHCLKDRGNGENVDRIPFLEAMLSKGWLTQQDLLDPALGGGELRAVSTRVSTDLNVVDKNGIGIDVQVLYANVVAPGNVSISDMGGICRWPEQASATDVHELLSAGDCSINEIILHSTLLEKQAGKDPYLLEVIDAAKASAYGGATSRQTDARVAAIRAKFNVKQKSIESDFKDVTKQLNSPIFRGSFGILNDRDTRLIAPMRDYVQKFAVITVSGKTMILNMEQKDISKALMSHADFEAMERDKWFERTGGKLVYPAKEFLRQPPRGTRFYRGGLTFSPSGLVPDDQFNLYRGLKVEPNPSGSCELMKELIRDVWCQGDERAFEYAWEYLMHIIAQPADKTGTCLAIRGAQGDGKSFVFEKVMAPILGDLQLRVANQNLVLGNFNEAVAGKLLITFEEAAFAGDRGTFERMKELATGRTVTVNPKHKAPYTIDNFARLVVISNNDHFISLDADDRRYTVFETTSAWQGSGKFEELLDQMNKGGIQRFVYEALNHTFRTQEGGRLVIHSNMKTEASIRQFAQSRSPLQKAIVQFILHGPDQSKDWMGTEEWSMSKSCPVQSKTLKDMLEAMVEDIDRNAARRVTLHAVVNELHRHIGQTKEHRPKGRPTPQSRERVQLPTQRVLPPRRKAIETARRRNLITQEEYESVGGMHST